jgi:hypothetical protein
MVRSRTKDAVSACVSLLLGCLAYLAVVGPRALRPTNIAWLSNGDPATHFLGWQFFRNSEWAFPLGLNPSYGLEISTSVLYSDSIPLFAFIFKPFASLFPQVFQYTGIWLLTCFLLQAWFGWKLIGLITKEPVIRVLGSGLFVFSLPMLFRLSGHFSLVGHFVILAAIYLSFRPLRKAGLMAWAVLLVVAAMVHAYLLVMVAAFWVTDLFRGGLEHKRIPLHLWSEFGAVLIIVGLACWQVGYFSVGSSVAGDGFGHYRMNLLSIFDPNGWSFVLNDIPGGPGEYEGFNYLGLGVIFLLLFGVPAIISGEIGLLHATRRHAILLLPLASLALFSLSNQVGIGQFEFTVSLPEPLTGLAAIFRSSGRMFWPVFYFILLLSIFIVVRGNNRRGAILLLTIALVAQVLDTRAKWEQLRAEFMVSPAAQWPTSMKAVFWEEAAQRYKEVRTAPPRNKTRLPPWQEVATYAGHYGMGTDSVYLARLDTERLHMAKSRAANILRSGDYPDASLYILDPAEVPVAVEAFDFGADALLLVDGFYVIAPGWMNCGHCSDVRDAESGIVVGERIWFSKTRRGVRYLLNGWAIPEVWGTWSNSNSALIVLPLAEGDVRSILIEANALVDTGHRKQNVQVRVNGVSVGNVALEARSGNRFRIVLPDEVRQRVKKAGTIVMEFRFPNSARPKDLRLNNDTRELALGIVALTVYSDAHRGG